MASGDKYHITLDNTGYIIKQGSYSKELQPTTESRYSTGNIGYSDLTVWQYFAQSNWINGFDQKFLVDDSCFYDNEYTNTNEPGEIKLFPQLTVADNFVDAGPIKTIKSYNGSVYIGVQKVSPSIWKWTGSGSATFELSLANMSTLIDSEVWDDKLYISTGAGGQVYTYNGTAWNSLAKSINWMTSWESCLWGNSATTLYKYDTTDNSAWTSEFAIAGEYMKAMKVFRGKIYYLATDVDNQGTYFCSYDGDLRTKIYTWNEGCRPSMEIFESKLWMEVGGTLYSFNGAEVRRELNLQSRWGKKGLGIYPTATQDEGKGVCAAGKRFYCVANPSATSSSLLVKEESTGFSQAIGVVGYPITTLGVFDQGATSDNSLLAGDNSGNLYYLNESLYSTSNTGIVESSWIDADLFSLDKLWNSLVIYHDTLPASTSITAKYKLDDDSAWNTFTNGTSNTSGTTNFSAAFPTGTIGKKLKYQLSLITANSAVTPTVQDVVAKYILNPPVKKKWQFAVVLGNDTILLDGTREPKSGAELEAGLWSAIDKDALLSFTDADNSTFNVIFSNLRVEGPHINQKKGMEYHALVELIES